MTNTSVPTPDIADILATAVNALFTQPNKRRIKRCEALDLVAHLNGHRSRQAAAAKDKPKTMTILVMSCYFGDTTCQGLVAGIDMKTLHENLAIRLQTVITARAGMGSGSDCDLPQSHDAIWERRNRMINELYQQPTIEDIVEWSMQNRHDAPMHAGKIQEITITLKPGMDADDVSSVVIIEAYDADADRNFIAAGHNRAHAEKAFGEEIIKRWPRVQHYANRKTTKGMARDPSHEWVKEDLRKLKACGMDFHGAQVDPRTLSYEQLVMAFEATLTDMAMQEIMPIETLRRTPVPVI